MKIPNRLHLRKYVFDVCMFYFILVSRLISWILQNSAVLWLLCGISSRWTEVCFQPWYNPLRLTGLKAQTNWHKHWQTHSYTLARAHARARTHTHRNTHTHTHTHTHSLTVIHTQLMRIWHNSLSFFFSLSLAFSPSPPHGIITTKKIIGLPVPIT